MVFFLSLFSYFSPGQGRGVQQAADLRGSVPFERSIHGRGYPRQPPQVHRRPAVLLPGEGFIARNEGSGRERWGGGGGRRDSTPCVAGSVATG